MNKKIDWKIHYTNIIALMLFVLVIPINAYLPEKIAWENSYIENAQIVCLFASFYMCLKEKTNKKLFYAMAMIIFLVIGREVNYGRMIFFAVEGSENDFYKWKEIKYGYLANPLIGLYILGVLIYIIYNRLYISAWEYIKKIRFNIWHILMIFVTIIVSAIAEEKKQIIVEEWVELVLYFCFASLVYLFVYDNRYKVN